MKFYNVNSLFLIKDTAIIQGLLNGTLTRHGGVIRETASRIVRHLAETSSFYLLTYSELSARLESLQAFTKLCHKAKVKNSLALLPTTKDNAWYTLSSL